MVRKILVVKHAEQEGPGLIGELFEADGWGVDVVELAKGDTLPSSLSEVGALVIMGGPMNVYEEESYPWLKTEDKLITKALVEEIPLLGICLGAQLLAKACGASIGKAPEKEIGWYTVQLTAEGMQDPLFREIGKDLTAFQWHEDTFEVPDGAVLLAQGETCPNQAFRVGTCAFGLQFHLEVTPAMIQTWMKGEEGKVDTRRILRDTKKVRDVFGRQARRVLLNFKQVVESSLRIRHVMKLFIEDAKHEKKKRPHLWWDLKEHAFAQGKT
jgi:GMP synthase (glutamine-hydrolysing)